MVGLYEFNPVDPQLGSAWFQNFAIKVKDYLLRVRQQQQFGFKPAFKCCLYRYTPDPVVLDLWPADLALVAHQRGRKLSLGPFLSAMFRLQYDPCKRRRVVGLYKLNPVDP
jgi:hypothetical protein